MSEGGHKEFMRRFAALGRDEQIRKLVDIGFKLTLEGRSTYEAGTERVVQPTKLRRVNEAQHLILTHLQDMLSGASDRYPDEVIAQAVMERVNTISETDQ